MERVARSSQGRWIAACDAAKVYLLSPAQKNSWPCVPSVWRDKEVPYRLWAGTPLVVRTHGLLMTRYPYSSANPSSSDAAARAHACWCAATSQAVQLVASALLDECYQHGRLFWLSEDLRNTIRRMGPDSIIGSGPGSGDMLSYLIDSIGQVRWDMVDPCGCQTASNTAHGTPVFTSGDAVSWDQTRRPFGELAIISPMRMSPREIPIRGKRLFGRMDPMGRREPLEGYGTRLPEWRGVPVDEMRQGGPESWELYAAGHYQEHLNRLKGSSQTGAHKKLLASNAHRNSRNTPQQNHEQLERPTRELDVNPSNTSVFNDIGRRDLTEGVRTNQGTNTLDSLSSFTEDEQQAIGVKFLSAFLQMMDTHKVRCELPDEMRGVLEKSRYRIVRELIPPRGQLFDVVPRYRLGALDVLLEQINKTTASDATGKPTGDSAAQTPGHGGTSTGKRARETQDEIQPQSASKKRRHTVWEIQPQ